MALIAIEEHWIAPGITSALKALAQPDESLAFNEMGSSTNAAALYGLDGVGLGDLSVGPAKKLGETIGPIGSELQ